jgi:hypothetical protein
MRLGRTLAGVTLATACLLVMGCASRYFHPAEAPAGGVRYTLDTLPAKEVWTGLVFNGSKVGFTHTRVSADPEAPGRYTIISEASLLLRILGFEKKILLKSRDLVRDDLTLEHFQAEYLIDGNVLTLVGSAANGVLAVTVGNAGKQTRRVIHYDQALFPASVVTLYPLLHGLEVDRTYRYLVFSGETQQIAEVEQRVTAFERSDLFSGEAYKLVTRLQGQKTTSWIDRQGWPLLEIGLNGVMISGLEEEQSAKHYLAAASLNKQDVLVDFSLVRTDRQIELPRNVASLTLELGGVDLELPSGPAQRCEPAGATWRCEIDSSSREQASGDVTRYLRSSLAVPFRDPSIQSLAHTIGAGSTNDRGRVTAILAWLDGHIRKEAADAFSALDVLATGRAECQGHAYLYTALARANGIPSRVANGLVYSEQHQGFLYHSWAESLMDGEWQTVDPTFGQLPADATHIKLTEGEEYTDIAPLAELVGKVSARIVEFEYLR